MLPMMQFYEDKRILTRINNLLEHPKLQSKNKQFLISIKNFFENRNWLSEAQYNTLQRIEIAYSNKAQQEYEEWKLSFDDEKRRKLKLVVEFYKKTKLFQGYVNLYLEDPNWIPTRKQYRTFVENNRYAQILLDNINSKPLFSPGDMVKLRKSPSTHDLKDDLIMVIGLDKEADFECSKGSRKYKVLVLQKMIFRSIHERDMRMARKLK